MQDCVLPTIQHTTSAIDGIKQDLSSFSRAKSGMPNEPLYEDKLNAHIAELEAQKAAQTALSAVYQSHILSLIAGPVGAAVDKAIHQFTDAKNQLSSWGNSVEEEIRKTKEKLSKLRQFNSQTNHLFHDSVSNLKVAMQGVKTLNGSTVNSDGSYSVSKSIDLKEFGKEIKGAAGGTLITLTVGGVKYKIKASDLAKLKDIMSKHKSGKFIYKGVSYFSKNGKFGKALDKLQDAKTLKKISSKIPSYKHSTISRDLANSKAIKKVNKITGAGQTFKEAGKIAKGFKVAGWIGTALSVSGDYSDLKSKGFSNGESAALTATHTAVSVAGSAAGRAAGTYIGGALGTLIPVPGVGTAVGAVVGGIVGSAIGGWLAGKANKQIDKSVKHNKKGLFGWGV